MSSQLLPVTASGRGKTRKKSRSKSDRSGLTFPVGRIHSGLKQGRYAKRTGKGSSVYLAAVLEYLAAEVLELAGNACHDNRKKRIIPRHIQLAVRNDMELNKLLSNVVIPNSGVRPQIHKVLLPRKSHEKKPKKINSN